MVEINVGEGSAVLDWFVFYPGRDQPESNYLDETVFADLGTWISEAGCQVIQLRDCARFLRVVFQQQVFDLLPPEAVPFFSYARYASTPGAALPTWLYTLFGYHVGDYRFTWRFYAQGYHEVKVEPKDAPLIP